MFSGAQAHPAYDSSAGQPEDDGTEQREEESGGERDGRGVGAGNNDRSYLTQQPAEDEWSSASDVGPLSGRNAHKPASASSATAAAAAAAAAAALAEEEAAEDNEQEGGRQTGVGDAGAPPSSSNGRGWDSVAAAAGGGVSEAGGSRFSHPGRGSGGAGVGGSVGAPRGSADLDLMSFRDGGSAGDGSEGDGSPLIAPSDIMRHVSTYRHTYVHACGGQ